MLNRKEGRLTAMRTRGAFISLAFVWAASFILFSCGSADSGLYDGDHFVWEVKSGETTAYLAGSIHMGKEENFPLAAPIEKAFENSEILAVELNPEAADPTQILGYMVYTDGMQLKDKISAENYAKLKEIFFSAGLPEPVYATMKPWAAVMTAQQVSVESGGYSTAGGIDFYFLNKAKESGKPILELETVEYQMSMFDEFDKVGDSFVSYSLAEMDSSSNVVDLMYEHWKKGDTEGIRSIITEEQDAFPDYDRIMSRLLDERNYKMAEKIEEWIAQKKKIFVVVGAAHLVGEKGLIELLNKTGKYKIRQL